MWCIPKIDKMFIKRMEDILNLYHKPYNPKEPTLCFDEKSKQLISDIRAPRQTTENSVRKRDYEYKRRGVQNIFVTVEPKTGFRTTHVTKRRTKRDTATELKRVILLERYRGVKKLHIVLDNLNTHFKKSFVETYGKKMTKKLLQNVVFHYTPCHASWLNMAEIEISIMSRQALKGRIESKEVLQRKLHKWKIKRNRDMIVINWKFTKKDAQKVFKYRPK